MANSSSRASAQQDHHHLRMGSNDAGHHPRDATKHRQRHHLQIQVPAAAVPANNTTASSFFTGCFRPSPSSSSSSSPAAHHHYGHRHGHADRPGSPSVIRSPTAWIRSFGSGKHARRRSSRDQLQYDATSYARNFEEGGTDSEVEEEAGGIAAADAMGRYRLFSSRLPTSPPAMSPSGLGPAGGAAGNDKGTERITRQTGRDLE